MRILTAVLLLAVSASVLAQTAAPTHLILTIDDPQGGHVVGASIDIDQPSTSLRITAKSGSDGSFAIDLRPGHYDLTVKLTGFMSYHQPLEVDATSIQQNKVNLFVELGGSSFKVTRRGDELATADLHATSLIEVVPKPIEIKVVVINMFEQGADTGDTPGEYQYWVEREHLDTVLPFPQGYHDLRLNPKTGVLGLLTGVGTAKATASVMALGLDPRFDLSHAYFLVAGIGGIDPAAGSLASAVWSEWIVDGDLGYEIDAREIPNTTPADRALWTTGYVPLRKSVPYEQPLTPENNATYHLNPALVNWAFALTKDIQLPDTPEIAARRMSYAGDTAHRPPFVLKGDDLSASTFWHGKLMNRWARDWVKYMTAGAGTYAICGMEDTGTLQSLTFLAHAHKVDLSRVLVLRTASNFDVQREGISAAQSLAETKIGQYSAYLPALDSAYRVGHVVVDYLVDHWPETRDHLPNSK
jgi:purine nucleoside permease